MTFPVVHPITDDEFDVIISAAKQFPKNSAIHFVRKEKKSNRYDPATALAIYRGIRKQKGIQFGNWDKPDRLSHGEYFAFFVALEDIMEVCGINKVKYDSILNENPIELAEMFIEVKKKYYPKCNMQHTYN